MDIAMTVCRQTKYCTDIVRYLKNHGHATNNEILKFLHKNYPELSATTVHRATARLANRHQISVAPPGGDGSMRYEANTAPHDHFMCSSCGTLKDANIKDKITPVLKSSIDDCDISGQIMVSGVCKKCIIRRTAKGEKYENNNL